MDDPQDLDPLDARPVEDGIREPSQPGSPDWFISSDQRSAFRERLEASKEPVKVVSQILTES